MSSIRSTWVLVLGVAVAAPALAATPDPAGSRMLRREIPTAHALEPVPVTASQPQGPSLDGAWADGSGPRIIRSRPMDSVAVRLPEPQPIAAGVGGAVALLETSAVAIQSQAPRGLTALLEIDVLPERGGSSKRIATILGPR